MSPEQSEGSKQPSRSPSDQSSSTSSGSEPPPDVWIQWGSSAASSSKAKAIQRKAVRSQAARSSAALRKSTMAMKLQQELELRQRASPTSFEEILHRAQNLSSTLGDTKALGVADFKNTVEVLHQLNAQSSRLQRALEETTLGQKAIRGHLREAMVLNPSLFQASLFVAGTYSNTCGLAFDDVQLGVGMLFMKGVSLQAVNTALLTATEDGHWTSMAVALLAGWELRFGEKQSYDIHMRAWQQVFDKTPELEETSISMLSDFTFATLREQLNDARLPPHIIVPSGFAIIRTNRMENISLLSVICQARDYDAKTDNPPARIRALGLQAMHWTPHHRESTMPNSTFELSWDEDELNALFHARAAMLSIIALHSHNAHSLHHATTYLDILGAADVHARSCQHLRTPALMRTKYAHLAVWARFVIGSISRDTALDSHLKGWLQELGIETWLHMKAVLEAHIFLGTFAAKSYTLFHQLMPSVVEIS